MTLTDATLAAWREHAATLAAGPKGGTLSVEAADMLELIEELQAARTAIARYQEAIINSPMTETLRIHTDERGGEYIRLGIERWHCWVRRLNWALWDAEAGRPEPEKYEVLD